MFVYLKTKEFLNKCEYQYLNYASGRILLAHIRTLGGYLSTDLGGSIFCISGSTQVWMCDDRTMLPCGLMVEVAFICEVATYVARFKLCNVAPTLW